MKQPPQESLTPVCRTMLDVDALVSKRGHAFASHGFLQGLNAGATLGHFNRFAPRVAFFVMCFQDVLRLVHSCSNDPAIKAIAGVHASEDKGHDLWYLDDLSRLGVRVDVTWLFSAEHQLTRDVAYGQVARVLSARHDVTRLTVALCLEAIGAECFGRAIAMLERTGMPEGLQYFARKHQQIEASHQVFEEHANTTLQDIPVTVDAAREVLETIDAVFAGMTTLMDDLQRAFEGQDR